MSKKTRKEREEEHESYSQGSSSLNTHGMSKYARKKQMQALEALRAQQAEQQQQVKIEKAAAEKAKAAADKAKARASAAFARAERAIANTPGGSLAVRKGNYSTIQELRQQAADEARAARLSQEYTGRQSITPSDDGPNGPSRLFTLIRKPISVINNRTDMRSNTLRQLKQERLRGVIISSDKPLSAIIAEKDGVNPQGTNGGTLTLRRDANVNQQISRTRGQTGMQLSATSVSASVLTTRC